MNLNEILYTNILESKYFRQNLSRVMSVEEACARRLRAPDRGHGRLTARWRLSAWRLRR